ncbi:C2 domain [Sesbania bispinosa]|nr:C2 domain [Sesbania bispinosa]
MSVVAAPFQLLEINIISAQDLTPVSKSIKAYAVAWLHPERKLATQIDQIGHTNPTWNEKFVFRVDDQFLNSESSVIMIEIYASAWLRDVLIGTVGVLVSNLLPPSARAGNRKPNLRFVALQIRRPSGRPQGILNIGVALLDSTMRSMPIYSELSTSAVGYWDIMDAKKKPNHKENNENSPTDSKLLTLQRCQSEKNDSTINDYTYQGAGKHGYVLEGDSEVGVRVVNANDESLCSDVGPSPSVVAAAIAKGIYPMPALPPRTAESSTVDGWSENNSTEGMNTKIERWRTELTPAYEEYDDERKMVVKQTPKRNGKTPRRPNRRGKLFSCFGTAFGCEFSITCGGGNRKKRRGGAKAHLTSVSELTYGSSI